VEHASRPECLPLPPPREYLTDPMTPITPRIRRRFLLSCLGPLVLLLPVIWISNLLILSVPDDGYSSL
jgi:hypothetical protein